MRTYSYWKPGGDISRVQADSTFHAAMQVLNTLAPKHCSGYSGVGGGGATYVNDFNQTCKLWEMFDNDPSN